MLRAALAALLLTAAPAWAEEHIGVHDPYALTTVPGAPTGAAYMLIHNHASEPDRLIGASSPVAERVELHAHMEQDGVMRMQRVEEGLELRAGSVLLLNRGGPHLMFLGITDPFEDGDVLPVTLVFEKAGEIAVEVPVDLGRLTEEAAPEPHGHGAAGEGHGEHMEEMGHEGHGEGG